MVINARSTSAREAARGDGRLIRPVSHTHLPEGEAVPRRPSAHQVQFAGGRVRVGRAVGLSFDVQTGSAPHSALPRVTGRGLHSFPTGQSSEPTSPAAGVTAPQNTSGDTPGRTVRTLPSNMATGNPAEKGVCGIRMSASRGFGRT